MKASDPPFRYEKLVIDPILKIIRKHQTFLSQPNQLPQLVKLCFLFEILWRAGRTCWGYDGILRMNRRGKNQCEDNTREKFELCVKGASPEIHQIIMDAWGLHVSNKPSTISWEEFTEIAHNKKDCLPDIMDPSIEWMTARLNHDFCQVIKQILTYKEVKETIDAAATEHRRQILLEKEREIAGI